ncbi:MAG: hypothetical protein ABEN55_16235 [Bradymonadaceae bacterium]
MPLKQTGCKYQDVSPHAAKLARQYRHFVENGNVPLHECPQWMVEVGQLIRRYRGYQDAARARQRKIDERKERLQSYAQES